MTAINYNVLNNRLTLLLIVVHVKHQVLYVSVARLRISQENVSSATRLLGMMCFTSATHVTWVPV